MRSLNFSPGHVKNACVGGVGSFKPKRATFGYFASFFSVYFSFFGITFNFGRARVGRISS
jgi:hypothetical protein